MDFTVAIRAYNSADRLPHLLTCLQAQTGLDHLQWEVVVVDNNSSDPTPQIVQQFQAIWRSDSSLRYVHEPRQGAAIARRTAVRAAKGDLMGFLDDDNFPAPDWVISAYRFAQEHPRAGAFGGQNHGLFEVPPPPNFHHLSPYLAIIERGPKPHLYPPEKRLLPPGAGLVVRRQAWLETVPDTPKLLGPVGQNLSAKGEDLECLIYIQKAHWEIWYNPTMHLDHQMPAWRCDRAYLLKLVRGVGLSKTALRLLQSPLWQRPLLIPLYFANDLRKALLFWIRHRHQLSSDTVTACQMHLLWSTCWSPFFAAQQAFARLLVRPPSLPQ